MRSMWNSQCGEQSPGNNNLSQGKSLRRDRHACAEENMEHELLLILIVSQILQWSMLHANPCRSINLCMNITHSTIGKHACIWWTSNTSRIFLNPLITFCMFVKNSNWAYHACMLRLVQRSRTSQGSMCMIS